MTLNEKEYTARRAANLLQSLAIIAMMITIMASLGLFIGGVQGLVFSVLFGALLFILSPRISPGLVLRMYRARPLTVEEARGLYGIATQLARRAGLRSVPVLHYIPSRIMNAFSVGGRDRAAIALTDGLIRALHWNELTAVMAHEMSHIQHDDLKIMGLADSLSRFTLVISNIGMILLFLYIPAFFFGGVPVPWILLLVLIIAPRVSLFLQLALSRTREFDADLNAVRLTGDPRGLATALRKIDRYSPSILDSLLMPGRKVPAPSVLRTHPHTERRIERLMAMEESAGHIVYPHHLFSVLPRHYPEVERSPRWKVFGLWH
ncbi:MAG: M48 family metalloprotease [Spirochaetes bacterium]|nr:M48 family metalloprotease [Spirochaetota bacterium]